MNIIAVVSAKEESRRLPGKNMKMFCGKPLLEWSLIQCKYSKYVNNIYLVTDGKEIAELGEKYGAHIVWETKEQIAFAEAEGKMGGTHSGWRGLKAAMKDGEVNGMYTILPSSPLRAPGDMDRAVDMMRQNDSYPILSGYHFEGIDVFQISNSGAADRVMFDNAGKYVNTGASIVFWTPQQFVKHSFKEPPDIDTDSDGVYRTVEEIIATRPISWRPMIQEMWKEFDIDTLEAFEVCEYWMEKKILQGKGEQVYKDYFSKVMSEYGYNQTAAQYNQGVENTLLPFEYRNSFFNHLPLFLGAMKDEKMDRYELVEHYKDGTKQTVRTWRANSAHDVSWNKLEKPEPALIIGSGTSLNDAGKLLGKWKGACFCSTSQATTLVYYGLKPSHIVAYDINSNPEEINRVPSWGPETTLITHPGVNPKMIDYWTGNKLLFRSMDTSNYFFMNILPAAYMDIVPSQMFLFSCSLAAQISIAKARGYSPLFLVGCNFAESRADFFYYDKGEWTKKPGVPLSDPENLKKLGPVTSHAILSHNGIPTDAMSIFYKRSLLCVWRIDHSQCILTYPEQSILTEMPSASFESVIACQGQGFEGFTDEQIDDASEVYLSRFNQFIVRFREKGYRVVESGADPNWEQSVRSYLGALNAAGDRQGEHNLIDIDANIERFRKVKEMAGA